MVTFQALPKLWSAPTTMRSSRKQCGRLMASRLRFGTQSAVSRGSQPTRQSQLRQEQNAPPAVLATMTAGRFSASALLGLAHCFCAGEGPKDRPNRETHQRPNAPLSGTRTAGLCPDTHVVQLVGGAGRAKCSRGSKQSCTEHDPSADSRGAEARTPVEADDTAPSIAPCPPLAASRRLGSSRSTTMRASS
jgi:hypothetical protein